MNRMTRKNVLRPLLLALAAMLYLPGGALAADAPSPRTIYRDGPSDRYLLDGQWLTRADPRDRGIVAGFQSSTKSSGWVPTDVPKAANAGDFTDRSYLGSVQWYRKDFFAPSSDPRFGYVLRFESVNYNATVWLNGRRIGRHTGSNLPFELAASSFRRRGVNRLVVRVDSRRKLLDVPSLTRRGDGRFTGGWWNYTGILREVYLRRVQGLDLQNVLVRPSLPCRACDAAIAIDALVNNVRRTANVASAEAQVDGRTVELGRVRVGPGRARRVHGSIKVSEPRLWTPDSPTLYPVRIALRDRNANVVQRYTVHTGIRSLEVRGGRLYLNDRAVSLRGASMHEDDPSRGAALSPEDIRQNFDLLRDLGANMTRAHYPLHPLALELADREGIVVWSEIPVYQMQDSLFKNRRVRSLSLRMLRSMVLRDRNHPSVVVWSVGNENTSVPGAGFRRYIRQARRATKRLDPTRLIGIAFPGYPTVGKIDVYTSLDAIGVNNYFGWYPGPAGTVEDRTELGPYMDRLRDRYPRQAIFVTEFGAEANRTGSINEKGTYEFQSDLLSYHLSTYAARPWINGALVWILKDFRVKPGYDGGNPQPEPPMNTKGLVDDSGYKKPAYQIVQQAIRTLRQGATLSRDEEP
jgi:beta-glucuronidase